MVTTYAEIRGPLFTIQIQSPKQTAYFPHTLNTLKTTWISRTNGDYFLVGQTPDVPIQVPEDCQLNFVITGDVEGLTLRSRSSVSFTRIVEQPGVTVFSCNFYRLIGIHELSIRVGLNFLSFFIDVCPRKLSYDTDLAAIRDDLEKLSRGLSMNIPTTGKLVGKWNNPLAPTKIEWITHLAEAIESLRLQFARVSKNPKRTLRRSTTFKRIEKVKASQLDSSSRRRAYQAFATLESKSTAIAVSLPLPDFQNPANIWLKAELKKIYLQILQTKAAIREEDQPDYFRLLEECECDFRDWLQTGFLRDVADRVPGVSIPHNVKEIPGYSQIFSILDSLSYGFSVDCGIAMLAMKPLDELYEAWCFVKVVDILRKITGGELDLTGLVSASPNSPDIRLIRGQFSAKIKDGNGEIISIAYNRAFSGITGAQRPDIVIQIEREGLSPVVIILDAKYRIDQSERYLRSFGVPGPPIDAINSLHRYRDAIVIRSSTNHKVRPVVKGAILFPPLPETTSNDWLKSRLHASISELGIGALPLLPDNSDLVEQWFVDLLSATDSELAWPGPDFEPYRSLQNKFHIEG